jgi:hypothetical protein
MSYCTICLRHRHYAASANGRLRLTLQLQTNKWYDAPIAKRGLAILCAEGISENENEEFSVKELRHYGLQKA